MEFLSIILSNILFVSVLLSYCLAQKQKKKQKHKAKLPPGSMGLPYVGETLQMYSDNPNVLFAMKQKRSCPNSVILLLHQLIYNLEEVTTTNFNLHSAFKCYVSQCYASSIRLLLFCIYGDMVV